MQFGTQGSRPNQVGKVTRRSINDAFSEDLQPSNPSLEVLRTSVKSLQLVKPAYEHGFNSFHEVRPQFIFEVVNSLVGVSQYLPIK